MTTRKRNNLFLFFLTVFFLGAFSDEFSFSAKQNTASENRLNVLLCTIDTLRADRLSCYQSPHLKTPTMDRLA